MNPEEKKNSRGGARLAKEQKPPKAPRQKKPKPQRTPKEKVLRILFIVLTVIATLIVVLFDAYKLLVVKPEIPNVEPPESESSAGM